MYSRENRFESDFANFIFEIVLLIVLEVFIVAKRANWLMNRRMYWSDLVHQSVLYKLIELLLANVLH